MDRVRPFLVLLAALAACLGAPAAAHAAAPTNTTPAAPTGWQTAPYEVEISGTDADGGPLTAEWRINTTFSTATAPVTVTVSDDGTNSFETRILDEDGNDSGWRTETVRVDARDPRRHRRPDRRHRSARRVADRAGQASPWRTGTLKVDTVDPIDTTTLPGSGWSATALSVPLSGSDNASGVTMEWQIDGGVTQTGSPAVVDADGEQLLEVRAVDGAGNATAWQGVTVPSTPPRRSTTRPRSRPPGAPRLRRRAVGLGRQRLGRRPHRAHPRRQPDLDGHDVSVTGDGVHTPASRVVDVAGHASAWRTDTIRIDSVAPTAAVVCTAAGLQYACRADASDDAPGLAAVAYTVDGGAWTAVAAGGRSRRTGRKWRRHASARVVLAS